MLNTSTYLRNATPLVNHFVADPDLRHSLSCEAHLAGTPNLGQGARPQRRARPDQITPIRTESLLLAPIWIGSAAAVLTAMFELVRSA